MAPLMALLSYLGSHWALFIMVTLSVIGLGAASWFLKNWKFAAAAIVLTVAGLGYQASNMDGYKRRVDEEAQAQVELLKTRILALSIIAAKDNERATSDAYLNGKLKALASETPRNDGPCLDAAAAHRVWAISGSGALAAPVPARRVPNVLPWGLKRPRSSPNPG